MSVNIIFWILPKTRKHHSPALTFDWGHCCCFCCRSPWPTWNRPRPPDPKPTGNWRSKRPTTRCTTSITCLDELLEKNILFFYIEVLYRFHSWPSRIWLNYFGGGKKEKYIYMKQFRVIVSLYFFFFFEGISFENLWHGLFEKIEINVDSLTH